MTHKEIAQRLLHIEKKYGDMGEIEDLRRELDPPVPNGFVWFRYLRDHGWTRGLLFNGVIIDGLRYQHSVGAGIEMQPAHILEPGQVAVTVPPVSEWPEDGTHVEAAVTGSSDDWWFSEVLSRAKAERMEAEK